MINEQEKIKAEKTQNQYEIDKTDKGWRLLTSAIIVQACKDFLVLHKRIKAFELALGELDDERLRAYEKAKSELNKIIKFFHSDYYASMVDIDGDKLIQTLTNRAAEERSQRNRIIYQPK